MKKKIQFPCEKTKHHVKIQKTHAFVHATKNTAKFAASDHASNFSYLRPGLNLVAYITRPFFLNPTSPLVPPEDNPFEI